MNLDLGPYIRKYGNVGEALNEALQDHVCENLRITLPAGHFPLEKIFSFSSASITHDDGSGEDAQKTSHIYLKDRAKVTLEGAVNENGDPCTVLIASNDMIPQKRECSFIWAENCPGLRIRNLHFTRDNSSCFSGIVTKIEDGCVQVRLKKDYNRSSLPLYCMNKYKDGCLIGRSITIGFDCPTMLEKGADGIFSFSDKEIAAHLSEGDEIAFRQAGLTDFALFFGHSDNLILENLRIDDASGYAILTEDCHNIDAERVVIAPKPGERASVSRDGWKIFRCSGTVNVNKCHFEGTRMDGQNVHTNYVLVTSVSGNTIICDLKYAPTPVREGAWLENDQTGMRTRILSSRMISYRFEQGRQSANPTSGRIVPDRKSRINSYEIAVENSAGIKEGDMLLISSMVLDEYHCTESVFRNIAGCGQIIKARRALIENCRYEHLMCPGVLAGAEIDTHREGMVPERVEIRDSVFTDCGSYPRYGTVGAGAIAAVSQGTDGLSCRNMILNNNRFINSCRGIELRNTENFIMKNCSFDSVDEEILMTEKGGIK